MKILRYAVILAINGLAVWLTALLLPGVALDGYAAALITAAVLAVINTFIRPLLVLLTLPITIFTLGIFILILNALLIMLADAVISGFFVENFWWAVLFSIVNAIIGGFLNLFLKPAKPGEKRSGSER